MKVEKDNKTHENVFYFLTYYKFCVNIIKMYFTKNNVNNIN